MQKDALMKSGVGTHNSLSLYLHVQHCMFSAGEPTELYFALFSASQDEFLSEEYSVKNTANGLPEIGADRDTKTVFTGLKVDDFADGDLYLVCKIYRLGVLDPEKVKKNKKFNPPSVRRPFGCGVLPLSASAAALEAMLEGEHEPKSIDIFTTTQESAFVNLHLTIIRNLQQGRRDLDLAPHSMGIATGLRLFVDTPLGKITEGHSHPEDVAVCRRMDASSVNGIKPRHDLFVTFMDGEFSQGRKKTAKNVQVRMSVKVQEDNRLDDVITKGTGAMRQRSSHYKSVVLYHSNNPRFMDTVCVSLPQELHVLEKCHLFFEFCHCSTSDTDHPKPFAFGVLPLMDASSGAVLGEGGHRVHLYKWQKDISSYSQTRHFGVQLANTKMDKLATKQVFNVHTRLFSTRATQDADLHKLLSWRRLHTREVVTVLESLSKKPTPAISALLHTLLNTLFDILASREADHPSTLHPAVFAALVSILADLSHVYHDYVPIFHHYMEQEFQHVAAYSVLLRFVRKHLAWGASKTAQAADAELGVLKATMKGMRFLLQLIIRSFLLSPGSAANKQSFTDDLNAVFDGINAIMRRSSPAFTIQLHSFAIRHFLCILDLMHVLYTSKQLATIVCNFIKAVSTTRTNVNVQKLTMMRSFVEHKAVSVSDVLLVCFTVVVNQVRIHIKRSLEEQLVCASIIHLLIDFLDQAQPPITTLLQRSRLIDTIAEVAPDLLRVIKLARDTEQAQLQQASAALKRQQKRKFNRKESQMVALDGEMAEEGNVNRDILQTLFGLLELICEPQHGQQGEAGASNTATAATADDTGSDTEEEEGEGRVQLRQVERKIPASCVRFDDALQSLRHLDSLTQTQYHREAIETCISVSLGLLAESRFDGDSVVKRFLEIEAAVSLFRWLQAHAKTFYLEAGYDHELWQSYIQLGMSLLQCDDLRLESVEKGRSLLILSRYGDLRVLVAELLGELWTALRAHHARFIELLVAPTVAEATSPVRQVQSLVHRMYYSLLVAESAGESGFERVEYHTIDAVDLLTSVHGSSKALLDKYHDFFYKHIANRFDQATGELQAAGVKFVKEILELFTHLSKLKSLPQTRDYEEDRTEATLSLISYLSASKKTQMHQRYLAYLCDLHKDLSNHVERGHALLQHRQHVGWSSKHMKAVGHLEPMKEYQRNLQLYRLAMESFDEAEAWEMSIKCCKELARVFEKKLFAYDSLSQVLRRQATYCEKVMASDRVYPSRFLVSFHGPSVEKRIRGRQFVYQSGTGGRPESVKDFTDRIKSKWPSARVVNTSEPIDSASPDSVIHITKLSSSCSEELDSGALSKWRTCGAPYRVQQYHLHNDINVFSFERVLKTCKEAVDESVKLQRGIAPNDYRDMWVEKVFVVTRHKLPYLQRRVHVVSTKRCVISPISVAIRSLQEKTRNIRETMECLSLDSSAPNLGPLSMLLSGVIDAAVQGGVAKYEEAFFDGIYESLYPSHKKDIDMFRTVLEEQLHWLKQALKLFRSHIPDEKGTSNANLLPLYQHLSEAFDRMTTHLSIAKIIYVKK